MVTDVITLNKGTQTPFSYYQNISCKYTFKFETEFVEINQL